jgi:hypothetical protein
MRAVLLLVTVVVVVLAYGIPLALCPLRWARVIGWPIPDDVRLARYFGRSLGAFVLAVAAFVAYLALHPPLDRLGAGVTGLGLVLVSLPHFWGMVERSQPLFETIEGFVFFVVGCGFGWMALSP